LDHWDGKTGPPTSGQRDVGRVFGVIQDIGEVDYRSTENGSPSELSPIWPHRVHSLHGGQRFWCIIVHSDNVRQLAVESVHRADYAVAELYRTSHDGVEDGLHIGRRACDHAQDFAGRGLLLACLVRKMIGDARAAAAVAPNAELLLKTNSNAVGVNQMLALNWRTETALRASRSFQ
jgi:hypothetical protein